MSGISEMFSEGAFTLPIMLSEEEIQERQATYFENRRHIEAEDLKLELAKAMHKGAVEPVKKDNKKLYTQIKEGVEMKTIQAIEVINEDTGCVDYINPDNSGEVLHSRPMTPSERTQYKIKFSRRSRQQEAY